MTEGRKYFDFDTVFLFSVALSFRSSGVVGTLNLTKVNVLYTAVVSKAFIDHKYGA